MGRPNEGKNLGFVAKVWDQKANNGQGDYRPIYIAPDATDTIQGDVILSDSITDKTSDATTGMTASTPKAVALVNENAETKLSKTIRDKQTVAGAVAFQEKAEFAKGIKGNVEGNLTGVADKAKRLETARTIGVKSGKQTAGSATFSGEADIIVEIPALDATTLKGMVPLSTLPQAALERLVKVANKTARLALTNSQVQTGDSVLQIDTKTMYIVVDDTKLNVEDGYQEYKAGTAVRAEYVPWSGVENKVKASVSVDGLMSKEDKAKLDNISVGAEPNQNAFSTITVNGTPIIADAKSDTLFINPGANVQMSGNATNDTITISATDTKYNVFTSTQAGLVPASGTTSSNMFLSADGTFKKVESGVTGVKGNAETSYRTGQVNLTPANIGASPASHNHDSVYLKLSGGSLSGNLLPALTDRYALGSNTNKWNSIYANSFVGNLQGNASTATRATSANLADTATKLETKRTISLTGPITGSVAFDGSTNVSIPTTIGAKQVKNGMLADDVGTVYIGANEPTEEHVKLWVKI